MSMDGFCDHTAFDPDEELHQHYAALLRQADAVLYGRVTYQLMQYWQELLQHPSGEKAIDDFAQAIDSVPKIVFSRTMPFVEWESARLSNQKPADLVSELKKEDGKDIFIGSRSLMLQLMKLNLIDEIQLCVHPVVCGSGLQLFENLKDIYKFKLTGTKTINAAVILYYEPIDMDK